MERVRLTRKIEDGQEGKKPIARLRLIKGKRKASPYRLVLNDLVLRRLRPPERGQLRVWDKVQKGLFVIVSGGGTKTFFSQFKLNGRWCTQSIGRYQENTTETGKDDSIRAAREQCRADRAAAFEGKDPRAAHRSKALTVGQAIARFVEEYCKPRQRSWDQAQASLLRTCKPWLDRPVEGITRGEVRERLKEYIKAGKHATARQGLAWVKTLWKWMASEELLEHDTMHPLNIETEKRVRDRVLTDAEIKATWRSAGKLTPEEAAYVRLMLLLAPRKTALGGMRWADLDKGLTMWTTPDLFVKKKKTAAKRVYRTPLPKLAKDILHSLARCDERVFPGLQMKWSAGERPACDTGPLRLRLIKHGAPADFQFHACRHTMASWLEDQGHDLYDRSLVLNHSLGGVTSGYSHGFSLTRKAEVLQRWSAHVAKVVA